MRDEQHADAFGAAIIYKSPIESYGRREAAKLHYTHGMLYWLFANFNHFLNKVGTHVRPWFEFFGVELKARSFNAQQLPQNPHQPVQCPNDVRIETQQPRVPGEVKLERAGFQVRDLNTRERTFGRGQEVRDDPGELLL